MKVKICGITTLADALVAVEAGADALGFILYRKSPRWVEPAVVNAIIRQLPPFVLPVGVFVNEEAETVRAVMDACGLALAQLHGDETARYCEGLGRPAMKALRLKGPESVLAMAEFKGRAGIRGFVVDAFSSNAYGGTGQMVDLTVAAAVAKAAPVLLAGGLTPDNVGDAMRVVRPYGVDVSSGVEISPGVKDHAKVRAFLDAVRLVTF
jgi:phosphoribosylanthranilate isomerase